MYTSLDHLSGMSHTDTRSSRHMKAHVNRLSTIERSCHIGMEWWGFSEQMFLISNVRLLAQLAMSLGLGVLVPGRSCGSQCTGFPDG